MKDEPLRITEKGIAIALEILVRDGFLSDADDGQNFSQYLVTMKRACREFIEASVAKGEGRSDEECRDGIVVAYFEAYIEGFAKMIN